MAEFAIDQQNRIQRLPERGRYDKELIYSIIDEALYCHVAFVQDGQPYVIPTIHARLDDSLIIHGARASRLLKHIRAGEPVSVAITLLDGLVLARSAFHHSMNYRSVVLFGKGSLLEDDAAKLRALETLTEHLVPGRWAGIRETSARELNATTVVEIPIASASAKLRTGPPKDDAEDYALPIWAGVLPIAQSALEPVRDAGLAPNIPVPDYVLHYRRPRGLPEQEGGASNNG
jgi:uncharacterized protein